MPTIRLSDLVEAFEAQGDGIAQYLDRETGEIVLVTEEFQHYESEGDIDPDAPAWMQDSIADAIRVHEQPDRYLELPSQRELVNHQTLRMFCRTLPDLQSTALLSVIGGKGTFRRFKDEADELGVLKSWYAFLRETLEAAAIQWCEEHEIAIDPSAV
jgi:hypothetical protein